MDAITARALTRTFRTRVKPEGTAAGVRALFRPEYRTVQAVSSIDLDISAGETVAFLGPNGAGKSTTIKMLTGILAPSSGTATVLGLDPSRDRRRLASRIGAVFGQRSQLTLHLPPADSFALLGAVYGIPRGILEERRSALAERFGIAGILDIPVRKLSLGQRIRCEIVASLLHAPSALFLDEPTIGLDIVARREIRTLLTDLNKRDGTTVFFTSHDMGDIERVCKRAVIIHHGEVVVDESMKALRHRAFARKIISVKYAQAVDTELPGLSPVRKTADAARYEIDTRTHRLAEVLRSLASRGEIDDLTVEDEPLENVVAEIYAARSAGEAMSKLKTVRRRPDPPAGDGTTCTV